MNVNELIDFLNSIYDCEHPFHLTITEKLTKRRLGAYFPKRAEIRLYRPLIENCGIDEREVAIHEYAHHIHYTELEKVAKANSPHGPQFWRIYSALMAKATLKGIYNDNYIATIILQ